MKILVLGSEGFIGSNLVKYFREMNFFVISADIVLKTEKDYVLINPEIPDFSGLFRSDSYDFCINATGAANVQLSFAYPQTDFFLNTVNVFSILEAIRLYNPECAFVNLSSAAVYGNPEILPVGESAIINPTSPYGVHKYYSEQICREYYTYFGIKSISARIFSVYGPGLKKQLFWDLHKKFTSSENGLINLYGTGKETRDFIYINDLVRAIRHIIEKVCFNGDVINVASGFSVSIENVVSFFCRYYDPLIQVKFTGANKKGDPLFWEADIHKLKKTGFLCSYNIEDGIKETVLWLKKQE